MKFKPLLYFGCVFIGFGAGWLTSYSIYSHDRQRSEQDQPEFIQHLIGDYRQPGNQVFILTKAVFVPEETLNPFPAQMVVLHGYNDNLAMCEVFREVANNDGGQHDCVPSTDARRGVTFDYEIVPPQYAYPDFIAIIWEQFADPVGPNFPMYTLAAEIDGGALVQKALVHGWIEDENMCQLFRQAATAAFEPHTCLPVPAHAAD